MIALKAPSLQDEKIFLETMQKSQDFHFPFIAAPKTSDDVSDLFRKK
ncbi:Ribosomal-protein-alanine acetyltransferase (fragment) [Legionella micdadei]|uniref:Ribosomal-protein-alanine N-acetyltransferase n=1 Tax=Legionella micdadei TaxID=451 RepID=A0A098GG77_LEGMI